MVEWEIEMKYSAYQEAVFDFGRSEQGGNGRVEAVAGSGKTTTAMKLIEGMPGTGLFSTFTKVIIEEAKKRIMGAGSEVSRRVTAQNYNSFGAGLIFKYMRPAPRLEVTQGKKTELIFRNNVLNGAIGEDYKTFSRNRSAVVRMVSLFKALGVLTGREAQERMTDVMDYYDVDRPKDDHFEDYLLSTWDVCLRRFDIIDFQDQVFLPVLLGMEPRQVDFLVIDEYQDTCPVESVLMRSACREGRTVVFGDPYQAIYSFKGTRPDSMSDFGGTRLPLSICYRCSRSVVTEARTIVNHIESGPDAVEGSVVSVTEKQFREQVTVDDMVLCRVTEDLIESVLGFLKDGRAAYVVGREYGVQLSYFVSKICQDRGTNVDISVFVDLLEEHFNYNHPLLLKMGKDQQAIRLESQTESLRVLVQGCRNTDELLGRITAMFTENGSGVRHMTIHKAKGLESNNVYILRPDKLPHPRAKKAHMIEEEQRLRYVAITRARVNLFYVQPPAKA